MPEAYPRVKRLIAQALRYYGVAGAMAVVYLGLVYLGLMMSWHYFLAILAAQLVSITIAFPLYRAFVFHSHGRLSSDFLRFASVWSSGAVAGVLVTPLLVEVLHFQPFAAQVLAVAVVSVASFLAHRWFSFGAAPASDTARVTSSIERVE